VSRVDSRRRERPGSRGWPRKPSARNNRSQIRESASSCYFCSLPEFIGYPGLLRGEIVALKRTLDARWTMDGIVDRVSPAPLPRFLNAHPGGGMIDDRLESTGKGILLISAIPLSSNRCRRNELPSVSSIMTMFGTQR